MDVAFLTIAELGSLYRKRELSREALNANVVRDAVVRFTGTQAIEASLTRPMRIVAGSSVPCSSRSLGL